MYRDLREDLKGILVECGVREVYFSKVPVPKDLPAGIISLDNRQGETKLNPGYHEQAYTFDVHLVVKDSENADDELLEIVEQIDTQIQEKYFIEIDKVEFYDSLLKNSPIRVATFKVALNAEVGNRNYECSGDFQSPNSEYDEDL